MKSQELKINLLNQGKDITETNKQKAKKVSMSLPEDFDPVLRNIKEGETIYEEEEIPNYNTNHHHNYIISSAINNKQSQQKQKLKHLKSLNNNANNGISNVLNNSQQSVSLKNFNIKVLNNRRKFDFYHKKRNMFMSNNIENQIKEIKRKEKETVQDFLKLIFISKEDYLNSDSKMKLITEKLNDDNLISLQSVKKPKFAMKFILETFIMFLGIPFFNWIEFQEKTNIYDLKYKMNSINYTKLDSFKVNMYLNKLYKNNKAINDYFSLVLGEEFVIQYLKNGSSGYDELNIEEILGNQDNSGDEYNNDMENEGNRNNINNTNSNSPLTNKHIDYLNNYEENNQLKQDNINSNSNIIKKTMYNTINKSEDFNHHNNISDMNFKMRLNSDKYLFYKSNLADYNNENRNISFPLHEMQACRVCLIIFKWVKSAFKVFLYNHRKSLEEKNELLAYKNIIMSYEKNNLDNLNNNKQLQNKANEKIVSINNQFYVDNNHNSSISNSTNQLNAINYGNNKIVNRSVLELNSNLINNEVFTNKGSNNINTKNFEFQNDILNKNTPSNNRMLITYDQINRKNKKESMISDNSNTFDYVIKVSSPKNKAPLKPRKTNSKMIMSHIHERNHKNENLMITQLNSVSSNKTKSKDLYDSKERLSKSLLKTNQMNFNSQTDKNFNNRRNMNKKDSKYSSFLNSTSSNNRLYIAGNYNTDLLFNIDNTNNTSYLKPKLNTTKLELNDYNEDLKFYNKEKKALMNIPLISNRTFNQMRKFYNFQIRDENKLEKYDDMHLKDLAYCSIQNPINRDKFYQIISNNKMKGIGLSNLTHYVNTLQKEDALSYMYEKK